MTTAGFRTPEISISQTCTLYPQQKAGLLPAGGNNPMSSRCCGRERRLLVIHWRERNLVVDVSAVAVERGNDGKPSAVDGNVFFKVIVMEVCGKCINRR